MAISLFRPGNDQERRPLPTGMGTIESDFDNNYYKTAKDAEYPQVPSEQVLAEIATRAVERRLARRELSGWQYTETDSDQQEEWDAFARRGFYRD